MALAATDCISTALCSVPTNSRRTDARPLVECSMRVPHSSTPKNAIGQSREGLVGSIWRSVKIQQSRQRRRSIQVTVMGIRAVENFDTSFELQPQAEEVLLQLLKSDAFAKQVAEQAGIEDGSRCTYTGNLFQPVPWSPNTPFGMPRELEKYVQDKEHYVVINVPPNFMFQAKIFKPSRLCAIFKRGAEESA
eukprot:TRINITY_DN19751_c0_g1_i1.p1 TRINITY_DN19751_c0_g1~~TRINITY_DN19751_c0_g1_i1.p1  ORF type:complete len:192 (-),score=21.67 TRINITY_DN19751_c0_g1_i1:383-958(-)